MSMTLAEPWHHLASLSSRVRPLRWFEFARHPL